MLKNFVLLCLVNDFITTQYEQVFLRLQPDNPRCVRRAVLGSLCQPPGREESSIQRVNRDNEFNLIYFQA